MAAKADTRPSQTRRAFLHRAGKIAGVVVGTGLLGTAVNRGRLWFRDRGLPPAVARGRKWLTGREAPPVVVIGGGAAGLSAALGLLARKIPVVMLEAGPLNDLRSAPNYPVDVPDEPFYTPRDQPFIWVRMRQMGGKLNLWTAHCPRMSAADFRGKKDLGYPWPITYEEIDPYYTYVERILGVLGRREGIGDLPDGEFVTQVADFGHELTLREKLIQRGLIVTPGRYAAYPRAAANSKLGRSPVVRDRIADQHVGFFRPLALVHNSILPNPLFSLLPLAITRHIDLDAKSNRVNGVTFYDQQNGRLSTIRAQSVVLAAGCIESTCILLNSKSPRFPNGLGNASETLGMRLTDHLQVTCRFAAPPAFRIDTVETGGVPRPPGFGAYIHCYGETIRKAAPEIFGSYSFQAHAFQSSANEGPPTLLLNGMGVMDSQEKNRITLTDETTTLGAPVPLITSSYSDDDRERMTRMVKAAALLVEPLGVTDASPPQINAAVGSTVHYTGTCRMGANPRESMVDRFCTSHEVQNLIVADGSTFASNPEKNPTLTIMALAWRAADRLADRF